MPTFRTTLWNAGGNNVGIVVPDEILASFDAGKRVPVVVTIDGDYSYRSTTAVMGGRNLISFNADTRAKTGKAGGDEVEVTLEHDTAPRTVEVPDALAAVFAADPDAAAAWQKLSPRPRRRTPCRSSTRKTTKPATAGSRRCSASSPGGRDPRLTVAARQCQLRGPRVPAA